MEDKKISTAGKAGKVERSIIYTRRLMIVDKHRYVAT